MIQQRTMKRAAAKIHASPQRPKTAQVNDQAVKRQREIAIRTEHSRSIRRWNGPSFRGPDPASAVAPEKDELGLKIQATIDRINAREKGRLLAEKLNAEFEQAAHMGEPVSLWHDRYSKLGRVEYSVERGVFALNLEPVSGWAFALKKPSGERSALDGRAPVYLSNGDQFLVEGPDIQMAFTIPDVSATARLNLSRQLDDLLFGTIPDLQVSGPVFPGYFVSIEPHGSLSRTVKRAEPQERRRDYRIYVQSWKGQWGYQLNRPLGAENPPMKILSPGGETRNLFPENLYMQELERLPISVTLELGNLRFDVPALTPERGKALRMVQTRRHNAEAEAHFKKIVHAASRDYRIKVESLLFGQRQVEGVKVPLVSEAENVSARHAFLGWNADNPEDGFKLRAHYSNERPRAWYQGTYYRRAGEADFSILPFRESVSLKPGDMVLFGDQWILLPLIPAKVSSGFPAGGLPGGADSPDNSSAGAETEPPLEIVGFEL